MPFRELVLIVLLAVGCDRPAPTSPPATGALDRFRALRAGMTLDETRALLGPPTADPGSGQPIEIYLLPNASKVELRYAEMRLISAKHGTAELLRPSVESR